MSLCPAVAQDSVRFVALSLLAALAACARDAAVVRYEDLVAVDIVEFGGAELDRGRVTCAEENRFAVTLRNGESLVAGLDLEDRPRMLVRYCQPDGDDGTLQLRVTSEAGEVLVEESLLLSRPVRWRSGEVDLAAAEDGQVLVSLTYQPLKAEPSRILVSDAHVRHRADVSTGWLRSGTWIEREIKRETEREPTSALRGREGEVVNRAAGPAPDSRERNGDRQRLRGSIPQILLVSVDTLRFDAVGALVAGAAPSSRTPNLDRLVRDSEVFSPHYAASSWTLPSHASLLTGVGVATHGATSAAISDQVPTLAERLQQLGLRTGGMVFDCVWLNPRNGFHRGFEDYASVRWGAGQISRAAVNWMASHSTEPFFFFLHTFDVHSDYFRLPYESEGTRSAKVAAQYGLESYGCRSGRCASQLLRGIGQGVVPRLEREHEVLRELYMRGVADLDVHLGQLLDDLRELGLYDGMLIIVTSDHGEMLLEHGDTLHGRPWEENLRVPLIVKWPGGARSGSVNRIATSSLDIAPTILAVAGTGQSDLPGIDLRAAEGGRLLTASNPPHWAALFEGDLKAIFRARSRAELYDLGQDPTEQRDLSSKRRKDVARLRPHFLSLQEEARKVRRSTQEPVLTDDDEERLRALGYLD
jgi:arylsulfatase